MKQRLLAILLMLCMVVALIPAMAVASAAEDTGTTGTTNPDVWDGTTFTQPTVGDGTEGNPYELSSAAQFMWFRNRKLCSLFFMKPEEITVVLLTNLIS